MLTGLRMVLALPVLIAALHDAWVAGFWLVVVALATDFLDGLSAKVLNARSRFGEQLDPLADFALATAGIGGIVFSGHLPLWVGLLMLVPALYVGYIKFVSKDDKIRIMQPVFSVPYLFAVWTLVAWVYASNAYGWSWWYVPLTLGILGLAAAAKRHRLRVWFGGLKRQR